MDALPAAMWGLAGGAIAGLLAMSADVAAAGFRWPWKYNQDGVWPRVFVVVVGLLAGALVAAAASSQLASAWPALIMGASAPSVVRGALRRVEVTERKSPDGREHHGQL